MQKSSLSSSSQWHSHHVSSKAIATEGKYWKRRIEIVLREYHKWRTYFKKRVGRLFSCLSYFKVLGGLHTLRNLLLLTWCQKKVSCSYLDVFRTKAFFPLFFFFQYSVIFCIVAQNLGECWLHNYHVLDLTLLIVLFFQLQKHKDEDLSSLLKVTDFCSSDGNVALLRCLVLCGALNAVYTNSHMLILHAVCASFLYVNCTIYRKPACITVLY